MTAADSAHDARRAAAQPEASPAFGPFRLQRLLGKSARTLVWLATDPRLRTAVRAIESDDEMLRATASCANEVVDALNLPARQSPAALQRVAQRYARALDLSLRDLQSAAQGQSPHDAPDDRDGPRSTWHPA